MNSKIERPKEFTDSEAESYTRFLTRTRKKEKSQYELVLEALEEWVKITKFKFGWK